MNVMTFDTTLPVIFMALMGISMLVYVVSDGYDLGVGMLMHRATAAEKDVMIASIGPFWDANETWLVLGIGILLVAFPKAHGLVLGELYLPVTLMLIGLTLRGVAFDFRVKAKDTHKPTWDRLFFAGSTARVGRRRAGCSGATSAASARAGTTRSSPRAIAVGLPMAYALLGAAWLVMKTEGELQRARHRLGPHRLGADGRRHGADLDGHAVDQRNRARALVRAAGDHRADGDPARHRHRAASRCACC